nr:MAG TPA: hypothetical protein [Caudoviricetes sp.]
MNIKNTIKSNPTRIKRIKEVDVTTSASFIFFLLRF